MKRITTVVAAAVLGVAGCASDAETESATNRTIELADSIDALLATLGGHMTDVLAADGEIEIRALETEHWESNEVALRRIEFWIEKLDECEDDEGLRPHTGTLYSLHDQAEVTAIAHILTALFADDVTAIAHDAELGYQIQMTNQMGALRANPLYAPDVAELYTCPVLIDWGPDVPPMTHADPAPAPATCKPGETGAACMPLGEHDTAPLTDCDPGTQGRACRATTPPATGFAAD